MASKAVEVRLEPVDNQRLARLCGALDENLRQIESALDVTIARRGGKFTVRGEQAQRAAQALEHFYDRANGDLTLEDVQLGLTEPSNGAVLKAAERARSEDGGRPAAAHAALRPARPHTASGAVHREHPRPRLHHRHRSRRH